MSGGAKAGNLSRFTLATIRKAGRPSRDRAARSAHRFGKPITLTMRTISSSRLSDTRRCLVAMPKSPGGVFSPVEAYRQIGPQQVVLFAHLGQSGVAVIAVEASLVARMAVIEKR